MSGEIIVKMSTAAFALTEWSFRKYRDASRADHFAPMLTACVTILSTAASRGELQCIVWPMWWPAPQDTVLDDEGNIQQPLGVRVAELHRWLSTFDESAASFTASEWWEWIHLGEARQDEQMAGETLIIGFKSLEHGKKAGWYAEHAERFINEALDAKIPARQAEIIKFIMAQPEATGTSPATWRKHIKNDIIGKVEKAREK